MRYVAELYRDESEIIPGEKLSIDTKDFEAKDDAEASHLAEEWAVVVLSQMLDYIVHLQVVQDGRGVFTKTYGDL